MPACSAYMHWRSKVGCSAGLQFNHIGFKVAKFKCFEFFRFKFHNQSHQYVLVVSWAYSVAGS